MSEEEEKEFVYGITHTDEKGFFDKDSELDDSKLRFFINSLLKKRNHDWKGEFICLREPTPSANDHKEYNRGVRTGVEMCRKHLLELLN